jgi:hypothetical protein
MIDFKKVVLLAVMLGLYAGCGGSSSSGNDDAGTGTETGTDADAGGDTDGDTDSDTDADADSDADGDTDSGTGTEDCGAEWGWPDTTSNLCWQNPPSADPSGWQEATQYCNSLALGGHDDWRLPSISELRSLIRGCVTTAPGGACAVTDDCAGPGCWSDACNGCAGEGPGHGGCFWDPAMEGACEWYWSSSSFAGYTSPAWFVDFNGGYVNYVLENGYARCVRAGS